MSQIDSEKAIRLLWIDIIHKYTEDLDPYERRIYSALMTDYMEEKFQKYDSLFGKFYGQKQDF